MDFHARPSPIEPAVYQRAIDALVQCIRPRSLAIYRVGRQSHPGLSDIDLLVVPKAARLDNAAYFSVSHCLPAELRAPFRSNPSIVPRESIETLAYTSHQNRKLLAGEDLAGEIECLRHPEQRWSMLFERLAQFERVHHASLSSGRADLLKLISKTKSVAYSLAEIDALSGSQLAPEFDLAVSDMRSHYFEREAQGGHAQAEHVWELFDRGLGLLQGRIRDTIPTHEDEPLSRFGVGFLLGQRTIPGLDGRRLEQRRSAVERYQLSLRKLGFVKGDIFVRTPYAQRIARLNREHGIATPIRHATSAYYRVRWPNGRVSDQPTR